MQWKATNTDAIASGRLRCVRGGYLTEVGERKQKPSNAIVSRVHSAIVERRHARSDLMTRAETL
jgi:hypothetical protein